MQIKTTTTTTLTNTEYLQSCLSLKRHKINLMLVVNTLFSFLLSFNNLLRSTEKLLAIENNSYYRLYTIDKLGLKKLLTVAIAFIVIVLKKLFLRIYIFIRLRL